MLAYRIIGSTGRLAASDRARPYFPIRLKHLRAWVDRARRNHTTRGYLAEMDDRMLADVGISRTQAAHEASRWMWD